MRWIPGLALLGVLCLSGPACAQSYYDYDANVGGYAQDPEALIRFWYRKYLNREADVPGMVGWAQLLRQGTPPANVLGAMLSSQEYYDKTGDTPQGFAQTLFQDVTGRQPTPPEFNWMMSQLGWGAGGWQRGTLAYDLLQRYPQGLYPSFAPGPAVAPPYRRDYGWREHEWHEHEYRRPDWRYRP
jgi:hypothetical protein